MNEENTEVVNTEDQSLEDFSKEFFGKTEPKQEEVKETPVENNTEEDAEPLATENEDSEGDEDSDENQENNETDEDPAPKKKKQSFQERFNEVYADKRAAEREAEFYRQRLEALEKASKEKTPVEEKPEEGSLKAKLPSGAPDYDAMDKDGEPIYPLGEFDPKYIADLTRFTIAEETKKAREEERVKTEQMQMQQVQEEIAANWADKVSQAEAEMPDIRQKIDNLTSTFSSIEGPYGDYLANVIMSSDVGPEMMSYFSDNIGEAQKIVASGPAAATLALGRLEARLMKSSTKQEQSSNNKIVSQAPEPPQSRNKGNGSRFTVSPDTDDLDAFSREFFKKK